MTGESNICRLDHRERRQINMQRAGWRFPSIYVWEAEQPVAQQVSNFSVWGQISTFFF